VAMTNRHNVMMEFINRCHENSWLYCIRFLFRTSI